MSGIALLLASCVDTPVPEEYKPTGEAHYLEVSQTELSFGSDAESKKVSVNSSQSWIFSDYAIWLNLSSDSGNCDCEVSIDAEENLSADVVRTSIFYLKTMDEGWNFAKTMSADQKAAIPYIVFTPESITTAGSASNHKINVNANTQWTARCDAEWVSLTPATDLSYLDVTLSENLTNVARTAHIIVEGAKTKTFVVTQNAANLSADVNTLEYSQSGGSYLLKINSEVAWSANTTYDWIDVIPVSGSAGEASITIATTPNWNTNSRTGSVGFYIGNDKYTSIVIKQDGVKLSAVNELFFLALGESKTVEVDANISWKVLSKPNWVSVSPESADGSSLMTVSVGNNSDTANRTGIIKLGNEGVTQTAEISVSQDGKYFSVNNEALAIGSKGGEIQVSLSTNDSWSISLLNNAEWLTVSEMSGEESLTVDFTAGDNPSVNPRSETATITPTDLDPVNVILRQSARYLTVDSEGVQFFSKGGTSAPIVISTDGKYTVTEQTDWFSVSHEGDVIVVKADVNETGHIRTGDISITLTDLTDGSMTLALTVTQLAPGGNFSREDYTEDNLWDATYNRVFTISVIGYASDKNWDEKEHHGITVTIEGYKGDENWDGTSGSGNMGKDNYSGDDSYNADNGSGDLGKDDYSGDNNYDNDSVE